MYDTIPYINVIYFLWVKLFYMENSHKKNTKERERIQQKNLNYVQLHKINKLSSYTTNFIQECTKKIRKKKKIH